VKNRRVAFGRADFSEPAKAKAEIKSNPTQSPPKSSHMRPPKRYRPTEKPKSAFDVQDDAEREWDERDERRDRKRAHRQREEKREQKRTEQDPWRKFDKWLDE